MISGDIMGTSKGHPPVIQRSREDATFQPESSTRAKKLKDRIQWPTKGGGGRRPQLVQEWRPKEGAEKKAEEEERRGEASKSSGESIFSPSKKRRLSNSGERRSKKVKVGLSETSQHSPSVFERIGGSDELSKSQDRKDSSGGKTISPSVFDRLGSQASSSSPKQRVSLSYQDHSAPVAAHFVNQSAQVAAKPLVPSARGVAGEQRATMKEGLMFHSNPSKSI